MVFVLGNNDLGNKQKLPSFKMWAIFISLFTISHSFHYVFGACTKGDTGGDMVAMYTAGVQKCFAAYKEEKDWNKAYDACKNTDYCDTCVGRLVTIPDKVTWDFLVTSFTSIDDDSSDGKINKEFWIGSKGKNNEGNWMYEKNKYDESCSVLDLKSSGVTVEDPTNGKCYYLKDKIDYQSCGSKYWYMCEFLSTGDAVSACQVATTTPSTTTTTTTTPTTTTTTTLTTSTATQTPTTSSTTAMPTTSSTVSSETSSTIPVPIVTPAPKPNIIPGGYACESNPCLHKGTCLSLSYERFNCSCYRNFEGERCEVAHTACEPTDEEEMHKRVVMMTAWSLSSTNLLVMLGILMAIFLLLLDFSIERLFHLGQELTLFLAHFILMFARTPTVLDSAAFCDEEANNTPPRVGDDMCNVVAVTLHFLFSVHFMFIFLESLHNYTIYTYVVTKPLLNKLFVLLIALLSPLPVVGLTAGLWFTKYTTEQTCWLDFDQLNAYIELTPAIILTMVAVVLSEATGMRKWKRNKKAEESKRDIAIANSKGTIIIGPWSCFAWIMSMLAVQKVSLSLYSLASSLNLVLGIILLILHTVGNEKARYWLKKICCGCGCCKKNYRVAAKNSYTEFP